LRVQVEWKPRRRLSLSLSLSVSLLALSCDAHAQQGVWAASFDHEYSGANATPYLFPGSSLAGTTWEYQPGGPFGWGEWIISGQPLATGKFNAIHMSLIPKGPYRGHVLVWNRYPVYVDVGPTYSQGTGSGQYWACQAWSIVNPDPNAPAPRFRNFLLPMTPAGNTQPSLGVQVAGATVFCSGHAWSPAGELVVAGGDEFLWVPGVGLTEAVGAKWLFLFVPSRLSAPFPVGTPTGPLYPGEFGAWLRAPGPQANTYLELAVDRYYPTVMLTHRLSRLGGVVETMIVAGGSVPTAAITVPGPGGDDPQNTYESYIVRASSSTQAFLQQDLLAGMTQPLYRGPGTTAIQGLDWFLEYPRTHLLSDGFIFLSGFVPNGVRWNPETPYAATASLPLPAGAFDYQTGPGSSSTVWGQRRDYGSTLFLARYDALVDVVLRLGGDDSGVVTPSSEICFATQPGASWNSLGDVTGLTAGRTHSNALALPDGSILVVGGNEVPGPAEEVVSRYSPGSGWVGVGQTPTLRPYHATMVQLPNGSVLIGGGDGRFDTSTGLSPHDYDVFEPAYMQAPGRPHSTTITNAVQDAEGTFLLAPNQTGLHLTAKVSGMASLVRIVLTAPGSVTHHSDMSARYIELSSTSVKAGARSFDVPAETVAPRGYYLLWAVDNGGLPAEAIWVRIQ